ncbi:MAG: AraC family transcriptional regulator [Oleiphilaceae bacterium]|nr:AraC family transcriptional regulator [Oleiphilaceae bacterium]
MKQPTMPDSRGPVEGSLFLWPDHWVLFGHLSANRTHQHVSASLLVSLDGPFALEAEGAWHQTDAALVAPDVPQALDPQGRCLLVAQLDPDAPRWRSLCRLTEDASFVNLHERIGSNPWLPQIAAAGQDGQGAEQGALDGDLVRRQLDAMIRTVGHPPRGMDARIERVCQQLRRTLPDRLDLGALGALVGLSSSRLTHLFRQETGVTLRRFLMHLKVTRAMREWQPGMSFSTLAAEAGFYDQPHLVRTARRMFDALPSAYVASGKLQLFHCQDSSAPS